MHYHGKPYRNAEECRNAQPESAEGKRLQIQEGHNSVEEGGRPETDCRRTVDIDWRR